ncbi:hypothetical protein BC829DRAFT_443833 [Chytridium lagenaria]|nr:hypothetical protein BC829DRAFT_443833 [Chytridium lagenaria]
MTTRAKMAAKTGIPENARLFQIKAGRDLPSIKERSNGIISEFRATCAIFQVPICQENLTRFIRNQNKGKTELSDPYLDASECETRGITVLDPRLLSFVKSSPSPSREAPVAKKTVVASSGSRRPGGVSKDEDRLSHLASSSRNPRSHHCTRESSYDDPMDEDDEVLRAGFEPASSEHMTNKGKEPLPDVVEWDEVFLFPKSKDPTSFEELLGVHRDQAIRQRAEGSLDPRILITRRRRAKTERTLGSNRYNIDLVFHLVQRLGDLGVEVTINEGQLKVTLLTRLYKTINGVRDMLVDSTNELAMLMGCGAFNIRQLNAETDYTDAALVAVRHDLTSCLVNSQMKVKEMRDRLTSLALASRRRAPRHPLSRPRVYGLANTKHLTSDVEGITKKLTLLQYRELRSGSSTPSSRPPLPLLRSADADVGKNTPLVDGHAPKVLTMGSNASSADPAAAIPQALPSVLMSQALLMMVS